MLSETRLPRLRPISGSTDVPAFHGHAAKLGFPQVVAGMQLHLHSLKGPSLDHMSRKSSINLSMAKYL